MWRVANAQVARGICLYEAWVQLVGPVAHYYCPCMFLESFFITGTCHVELPVMATRRFLFFRKFVYQQNNIYIYICARARRAFSLAVREFLKINHSLGWLRKTVENVRFYYSVIGIVIANMIYLFIFWKYIKIIFLYFLKIIFDINVSNDKKILKQIIF